MLRKLAWGIGAGALLAALVVSVWYVQLDRSASAQPPVLPRLPLTRPPAVAPAPKEPPVVAQQPSVLQAPPQRREFVPLPDDVPRDADGLTAEERVNVMVYENCNRSVVNISTRGVREATIFMIDVPTEGAGSGSILDKQGNILTNYHVIENAREIEVTLFDGSTHEAELVGKDSATDIAVIRITTTPDKLFPVVYGDSARLKVGQRVFAIGNPFGLERTLTTGIVSSLNRQLPSRTGRTMKSIIQIDAAINPGNSGGPLLDSRGRLIGMNTAIASRTGQNTGVGFAVPVSNIARVVPQLLQQGRVVRPDIGIQIVFQTERGLLIAKLAPGGPAERAGLRGPKVVRERKRQGPFVTENELIDRAAADLIVGVDGQRLTTADEFLSAIESRNPGDETVITVVREGRLVDIPVRLGES
ncbi:MAG: trypsin-like peptidase domain-containing protein [Planctomycetaceae bacterium]|nr:trypsin-like peptidase domain-containing protein [Planctomycetaceae bacterium]